MDPSCLWSPQVVVVSYTWRRHQMEAFSALLVLCDGNPPVTGGFPLQRPVTRSFEFFFDLLLNKRLSKQSRRRWFETPSRSLWHHCNGSWCYKLLNVMQNICCPTDRTQRLFRSDLGYPVKYHDVNIKSWNGTLTTIKAWRRTYASETWIIVGLGN